VVVRSSAQCEEANRTQDQRSSCGTAVMSPSKLATGRFPGAAVNGVPNAMTDQGMIAEMASLLQIIERHWNTHFDAVDEIDSLTVLRVRSILTEHRRRYHKPQ
jgi:hypothetical protein